MTDKGLIRYAAKAAGVRLEWIGTTPFDCTKLKPGVPACKGKLWMPLHDDGDALRLAVRLRMGVTFNEMDVFAFPQNGMDGCSELVNVDDSNAATRRAITRAAAEIGWAMP